VTLRHPPHEDEAHASFRASDILTAALAKGDGERVSIGELIDCLGDRAFGALILLFALPTILPAPPGLSALTGMPIVIFSFQLLWGSRHPWLPAFLRRRQLGRADLLALIHKADPYLQRIERLCKPRLSFLAQGTGLRTVGFVILLLSAVLVLPIFMGNILPSIAIAIIALAQMERDGAAIIVGYMVGVVSVAVAFSFILVSVKIGLFALHSLLGL
jgi:hypothetical protein